MISNHIKYNTVALKNFIRTKLNNELNTINSPFCLYADEDILAIINFIYDYKFSGSVHTGESYKLSYDYEAIDVDKAANIVFMIYPDPKMIRVLASMIQNNESSNIKKNYHLFIMPAKDFLCMEALQQLRISHKIKAKSLNFDFLPLRQNLFSLELPIFVKQMSRDKFVVESLLRMCNVIGSFRGIYGLGQKSQRILEKFDNQMTNISSQLMNKEVSKSSLIMLDRQLDLITPMLTAFSYEALLDMFFGIKNNQIQIPGKLIDSEKPLQTFLLNTAKNIHYEEISKMLIREVPQYLIQKSDQLSEKIRQLKDDAKNFDDLNEINEKLVGQLILLQHHKSIVTFLMNEINSCPFMNTATLETVAIQQCQRAQNIEYLSIFYPIEQVLKLEVLSSQVSDLGSYYPRFEKTITKMVLECFHPKHLITVNNLVKNSIIKSSKAPLKWKSICQKYDLIPDQPHSYTNIHIIYSALLVRFIQLFLTDNLNNDMIHLLAQGANGKGYIKGKFNRIKSGDTVYVYLLGGLTYAQRHCFQALGRKMKIEFVLCTDQMTSGQKIIKNNI